jgi:hypothetical protein
MNDLLFSDYGIEVLKGEMGDSSYAMTREKSRYRCAKTRFQKKNS